MQSRNNANLKGIDISHHNGTIDFNKVKAAGVQIVYMKATEKTGFVDPMLKSNYAGAKAAGLKVGFYHFFRGNADAKAQAQFFINTISGMDSDCRLMIDLETTEDQNPAVLSAMAKDFLEEVIRLTGKEVVVYTYTDFARHNITTALKVYPLWIAHYNVYTPGANPVWDSWIGFQYTSDGYVDGVAGRCDVNEFTQDILLSKSAPEAPKPQPQGKESVKKIQQLCNALHLTDKYGHALAVDGIPGPLTASAVAKLPLIKQGSGLDEAIKVIQAIVGTKVDGAFGPKTLAAVKAWQTNHGLVSDGIVGPKTWAAMLNA